MRIQFVRAKTDINRRTIIYLSVRFVRIWPCSPSIKGYQLCVGISIKLVSTHHLVRTKNSTNKPNQTNFRATEAYRCLVFICLKL